jgi:hypothetical protein
VTVQVPVFGSYSSAVSAGPLPSSALPPATRTLLSRSSVAVAPERGVVIPPVQAAVLLLDEPTAGLDPDGMVGVVTRAPSRRPVRAGVG